MSPGETKKTNEPGGLGGVIKTGGLVLSGSALALLVEVLVPVFTSRNQQTTATVLPSPLTVEYAEKYVTVDQFNTIVTRVRNNEINEASIKAQLAEFGTHLKSIDGKLYQLLLNGNK